MVLLWQYNFFPEGVKKREPFVSSLLKEEGGKALSIYVLITDLHGCWLRGCTADQTCGESVILQHLGIIGVPSSVSSPPLTMQFYCSFIVLYHHKSMSLHWWGHRSVTIEYNWLRPPLGSTWTMEIYILTSSRPQSASTPREINVIWGSHLNLV